MKSENLLKRLEIQGFKSFAHKTILEFPGKITAIVGPNGSGKSNILDALKWVLGEREAKQLRGEKLENLIFSGSPQKPPASLARVSLYFDNRNRIFPIDAEEVSLSRRIDRSGVSKFFLNETEIKLKDLVTILAKARIGSRSLMIINQGESDIFVKSRPQERQRFIEEILGLREFQIKKNQAERQLVQSKINLEKARALLEELKPRLKILRRQKNRFEKREQIEKELKKLEDFFFVSRYQEIQKEIKILDDDLEKVEKEFNEVFQEVKRLEKELEKIETPEFSQKEIEEIREKIKELLEKRSFLEKGLTKIEVEVNLLRKNKNHPDPELLLKTFEDFRKEIKNLLNLDDLTKIKNSLNLWLQRINKILDFSSNKEKEEKLAQEETNLKNQIKEIEKIINDLNQKEIEILNRQNEANKKFRTFIQLIEEKKQFQRNIERKKERILFEKEKLENQLKELEHQFELIGRKKEELKLLSQENFENLGDLSLIEQRILKLRGELAIIGEIDPVLLKESEETEARYQFLVKEIKDLEKASADLKILIKNLEEKINHDFQKAFHLINKEFNNFFRKMFNGGRAHLKLVKIQEENSLVSDSSSENQENFEKQESVTGVDIEINLPRKKIKSLEMLSGGEKSLVSLAALFALISVSPPPFLFLDEIDATLDEINTRRFSQMIKDFSQKTQFILITHNRATMEAADLLYGVTMGEDGVSRILSLKLE